MRQLMKKYEIPQTYSDAHGDIYQYVWSDFSASFRLSDFKDLRFTLNRGVSLFPEAINNLMYPTTIVHP